MNKPDLPYHSHTPKLRSLWICMDICNSFMTMHDSAWFCMILQSNTTPLNCIILHNKTIMALHSSFMTLFPSSIWLHSLKLNHMIMHKFCACVAHPCKYQYLLQCFFTWTIQTNKISHRFYSGLGKPNNEIQISVIFKVGQIE